MGRKSHWPPAITVEARTGLARVRHLGKTHYLGRAGSVEARAAYAKLLQELAPTARPMQDLAVEDCVNLWLAHASERYGGNQEVLEYGWALAPVTELFARLPVGDFDAGKLEEARDVMIRRGWCRNVVNRRIVRVRTAWRWLERRGHAPKGSWAGLRALEPLGPADRTARRTEPVKPATWETVQAVLPHLAEGARGLLLLLWHTGARPGELYPLTADMIDRTGDVWTYEPTKHKCAWRGHKRLIAFGPEAQLVLQVMLDEHPSGGVLFRNTRGSPYNMRSFYLAIRRASKKAGVRLHAYQLRHSARLRITRASDLETARQILGHASAETTAKYASGIDEKTVKDAARKVG